MTGRPPFRRTMAAIVLVAAAAAACTTAPQRMVGTGDVVADRQRVKRLQGASFADIQEKFKAGNITGIAVDAEVLAITAMQIPSLFPEGSLTDRSEERRVGKECRL